MAKLGFPFMCPCITVLRHDQTSCASPDPEMRILAEIQWLKRQLYMNAELTCMRAKVLKNLISLTDLLCTRIIEISMPG